MTAATSSTRAPQLASGLPAWLARLGHRVFRYRDGLFPLVLGSALIVARPVLVGGSVRSDLVVDALGLMITLSGQLLRVLVIGLAYIKRGGRNRRVYAKELVQEGLFAHSRNPLYVGNVLVIIGLAVIHGSPIVLATIIPVFCLAYLAIVAAEEEYLLEHFGAEYERYRSRVPRFLPSLGGLTQTVRGMSFDWRKVLRSEYGSTASWMTTAALLLQWELLRNPGAAAGTDRSVAVAVALAGIGVAWASVRVLKKTGRLETSTS